MKKYYVYLHRRATDGSVFYVGKGCGDRAGARKPRNEHWHRIVNKNGFRWEIIKRFDTDDEALLWEQAVISHYGLENLANMTVGGDGKSGCYYRPIYCSNGMHFKGVSLAAKWLNENGWPKADTTHLSDCANGKRNSAYGFAWSFKEIPSGDFKTRSEASSERSRKKVYCSNGMDFLSATHAQDWLMKNGWEKASHSAVSRACREGNIVAYGHSWSYVCRPILGLTRSEKLAIRNGMEISCSNGMVFPSVEDAAKWLRGSRGDNSSSWGVRNAARSPGKKFKGFTWAFTEKDK